MSDSQSSFPLFNGDISQLEKRLWESADQLRANSNLSASEYSNPVLGLIFLRYADHKFSVAQQELEGEITGRRRRGISKEDFQAEGVMYLPEAARFSNLLNLPEGENIGMRVNDAMRAVEAENEELKDVLPKTYNRLENSTLVALLRSFAEIPMDVEGDVFGKIYEYFLGKFAMSEGQRGGEFFTPTSIVKLIVEVMEPYQGRILDPACGSGGMFVQSARFVENHKMNPNAEISIYGQERVAATVRLCRMNLAVHGLSGDIRQANSYYENIHNSVNKFDFVMANPPFNVNGVDKERIKDDPRYPFGMPRTDNANYLWIQEFFSTLNKKGRAGFVWADDGQGNSVGGFGLKLTARDMAKIGYLYLQDGRWEGRQIVPRGYIRSSKREQVQTGYGAVGGPAGYGYLWWTRGVEGYRAFYASGSGGQFIYVIPELDLVVVIVSEAPGREESESPDNLIDYDVVPAVEDE